MRVAVLFIAWVGVGVAVVGAGCGGFTNTSLGVPHEDPEPIGSAPWEQEERARDADETKPSTPEELKARSAARAKRRSKTAPAASSAPSPTVAPSSPPPDAPAPSAASPLPSSAPSSGASAKGDAPLFENLDLVFGDAPRALDARERDGLVTLAKSLKGETVVTLSAHAKKKAQADGWLAIHKKVLVDAGVDATKIVTQVCLENAGLTHTVIARGTIDCDGH